VARQYDPYLNRFLSPDSIVPNPANPQSLNRYSYVLNNPLKYTDPTGHREILDEDEDSYLLAPPPGSRRQIAYTHRADAAAYATGRAKIPNDEYFFYFPGGDGFSDCTNFASQSLWWGGLPMTERWHGGKNQEDITIAWSWTWTVRNDSDGLLNYLEDLGYSTLTFGQVAHKEYMEFPSTIKGGDIVFYHQVGAGAHYNHAAVVVGWGPSDPREYDGGILPLRNTGGLIPYVAEHTGSYPQNPRPINYTTGPVNELVVVMVPEYQRVAKR